MAIDLTKQANRIQLIKDIDSSENKGRKAESFRQTEIFNDRIFDHVYERLIRRSNEQTVMEMPLVSSINLARRIAKQEASIYRSQPERTFTDTTDAQMEVLDRIYDDMGMDAKMLTSNESFKLQNQNHVMIIPKNGKLIMRVLRNHHVDSIDDPENPDMAIGYVISQIDKNEYRRNRRSNIGGAGGRGRFDSWTDQEGDFRDQSIGDDDDWQKKRNKYLVWTKDFNFVMDGKGNIISGEDISNPIGMVPIVDISIEKDFEYWVRQGDSLTDFTVEFNSMLSDVSQVVRMQGYAQAYLIARDDLIPQSVQVGPNHLLRLPVEEGSDVRPEFGFASPGADLAGSINFAESLLATFLTSRGLDPSTVSGSGQVDKASSGIERLLKMIEKFEASRSDFDTYNKAEKQIYNIVKAWHNVSLGTSLLDNKYKSTKISEDSELSIQFGGPEMIKSEAERIDNWDKRIERGESTVIDMMMDLRGISQEEAEERLEKNKEIELRTMGVDFADRITELTSNEDS